MTCEHSTLPTVTPAERMKSLICRTSPQDDSRHQDKRDLDLQGTAGRCWLFAVAFWVVSVLVLPAAERPNVLMIVSEDNGPELAKELQLQLREWRHTVDAALPTSESSLEASNTKLMMDHCHAPIHSHQHASPTMDRIRQADPRSMEAEPFGPGHDISCMCMDAGGRFGLGRPGGESVPEDRADLSHPRHAYGRRFYGSSDGMPRPASPLS